MASAETPGAILTVDLDGIAANYRMIAGKIGSATAGAVVKADAYGMGLARVATALARAGCTEFFVATLDEGLALRQCVAHGGIHVLNGLAPGEAGAMAEAGLTPVLNSLDELHLGAEFGRTRDAPMACDLQVDTGLTRLGLDAADALALADDPTLMGGLEVDCLMSHLACAEVPDHPMNGTQLTCFAAVSARLPARRASIAASSGVFLGDAFHLDLVRTGVALYGVNPTPSHPNPMAQVLRLQARILQVRVVDSPQTVGYGASHRVTAPGRVATVAVGYADGYPRSLGNKGTAYIAGRRAPVLGRISMDLTSVDVSGVAEDVARPGAMVDLIGPDNAIDDVALDAGTIGYEILTGLGPRIRRRYLEGDGGR